MTLPGSMTTLLPPVVMTAASECGSSLDKLVYIACCPQLVELIKYVKYHNYGFDLLVIIVIIVLSLLAIIPFCFLFVFVAFHNNYTMFFLNDI